MAGTHAPADILALSVHGPIGVLDLVVPARATAADVAGEYARQSGLGRTPALHTRIGDPLAPDLELVRAGVGPGDLLVATVTSPPGRAPQRAGPAGPDEDGQGRPGPAALGLVIAVGAAAAAGWCAAIAPAGALRTSALVLLILGAAVGVVPVGARAVPRVVAAPAFAAAAAFALVWDPHDVRVPVVLGAVGLAAALTAATGRALAPRPEEVLRVWIVAGVLLFVVTGLAVLAGSPPRLTWALLLVGALLAARFVPGLAIDVPDQYLIDLDRLAVTAWSARERAGGARRRSVVPLGEVGRVAARGTRLVTAACAAISLVAAVSAPLLLETATLPIDRIGARLLVGFAGGGLLLAARSYRHSVARALLRTAGLACWTVLFWALLRADAGVAWWVAATAILLAVLLVVVAVALGRGWRSAWWSRRAEVAEGICGAFALASLVVAAGWFRGLWEMASLWNVGT